MIITNVHNKEVLECWDFKVQNEPTDANDIDPNNPTSSKELKRIQMEIGSVMRQIASTVTYLPLLDGICSFDVLIYTLRDCEIPEKWNETEDVRIENSQAVNLRTFTTGLHKMETIVNYRLAN